MRSADAAHCKDLELPDLSPLQLSLLVSVSATILVVPVGTLLAWWLGCGRRFPGKVLVETALTLPLVLPPTVVGFYLLLLFGNGTAAGRWLNRSLGIHVLFTWQGAAIAAAVMAAPLYVRTMAAAFATVDRELLDAGRAFGASEPVLLIKVILPVAYRGALAGIGLAFARALGEFGATLMVAGN
ncbi:MAG TPA: ABC transporter permease subunit, partial [Chthonomonadales bacterium]|nr:ABC transporter permease subunit [Chthonomonadales bacterium]